MRFVSKYSIRFTFPAVLGVMAALLVAGFAFHTWYEETREWESLMRRRAEGLGKLTARRIEYSLPIGTAEIGRDFVGLAAVPNLVHALAFDDRDLVIFATAGSQVGQSLRSTPHADAAVLLARARSSQLMQFENSPDGEYLRAAFPFAMPAMAGEPSGTRTGIFYTESDLGRMRREILGRVGQRALVLSGMAVVICVALGLYLHFRYVHRVERLLEMAGRLGRKGAQELPRLEGSDELARIGRALGETAKELEARAAALEQSEARYRLLARNYPKGAILLFGPDMRYTLAEGTELAEMGIPKEDFEGQPVGSVLPGAASFVAEARAALGGRTGAIEFGLTGRHYQVEFTPVRDVGGEIVGGMAVLQNDTERREALERLRASEARFSGLVNNLDGILWRSEAPFARFSFVSPQAQRLLGYPLSQWLGEADFWANHILPEDRAAALEFRRRCGRERKAGSLAYRMTRANGEIIWLRDFVTVETTDGGVVSLQGVMLDVTEFMKSKLELQERELHYRVLFESSPDAVLVCAADGPEIGRILAVNDAGVNRFGWPREELLRMNLGQLAVVDAATSVAEQLKEILSGRLRRFDRIYRTRAGVEFPVEISAQPLVIKGSLGVISFVRDVTEQRRQAGAVIENQHRLQVILETMTEGLVVQNCDGQITECNPAAERILGLRRSVLIGMTSEDPRWRAQRFDGTELTGRQHPAMVALNTGRAPQNFLMSVRRPDDSLVWLEVNSEVMRSPTGQTIGVVSTFSDVTDMRLAVARSRESELRMEGIINSAIDGIITVDVTGRILVFNAAAEAMFGYRRDEIVGQSLEQLLPERFRGAHAAHVQRFSAGARSTRPMGAGAREIFGLRRNGEEFPIEASISQVEAGSQKLLTVILRDVSQRVAEQRRHRELEQQLLQAQKMETLGTLTGAIAHDFNNLLTGILGHIDLAAGSAPGDPTVPELLGTARRGTLMARDLVKRLLLFARKRTEGPLEPLNLPALLRETIPLLTTAAGSAISVKARLAEGPFLVLGDASQLQQVLMNLGINAIHAIGSNRGEITVALDEFTEAKLAGGDPVPASLAGGCVCVAIADTGSGMDAETQRRLFEPFFTTKEPGQGTGLGLAIVHGVIFAHGGQIRVHSEVGRGTTFFIYLPLVQASGPVATENSAIQTKESSFGGLRVLVVDDEAIVASLLQVSLTGMGARVTMFTSAKAARDAFLAKPASFDAAVLDLAMPELTGLELAQSIRAVRAGFPLVLASGDMHRHDLSAFEQDDRTILVPKPFDMAELRVAADRLRALAVAGGSEAGTAH